MKEKIQQLLNEQIKLEIESSFAYLHMASDAQQQGYDGISDFLFKHAEEERFHMIKLVKFLNDRDGEAHIPDVIVPRKEYNSFQEMFKLVYEHEVHVTNQIHQIVEISLQEKDYATHNFLQWYVTEQLEEEKLFKSILDKFKIIGDDRAGLYMFDRDINSITVEVDEQPE